MAKLTPNFSDAEFVVSKNHPDLAVKIQLTETDALRLKLLSESLLQPIRNEWRNPMTILSGIRSPELNEAVRGSKSSDHLHAIACDWTSKNLFQKFMWAYHNKLPYRQLIFYPDQNFIHCSINIPGRLFKTEAFVKYSSSPDYLPYTGGQLPPKPIKGDHHV